MEAIAERGFNPRPMTAAKSVTVPQQLRIAMCVPEIEPLQNVMVGKPADATYILQRYIIHGLTAREHRLSFLAKRDLDHHICTTDPQTPTVAPQSWSASRWFGAIRRNTWRIQQRFRTPYLSVFFNLRLFDESLHVLPGHDIVYERNSLYRSGIAFACKWLKLPYVLFVEADEILEHDIMGKPITGLKRWGTAQMFRYNLHAADSVICVSEQSKAHLVQQWRVPADKITVFPNAVEVSRFRPLPQAQAEIRRKLDVDDAPLILFVGAFYKWHDVGTVLDAFAQILATQPDVRLALVGDGEKRQAMMARAVELQIDHAVRFTGFVDHTEIPHYMSAADIAVAPYPNMEQALWLSPLKLFEYMAAGTAVIASAIGQPAEIVRNGHNGLLVPPSDSAALANALTKLLRDDALRRRLGAQAKRDIIQNHSWDQYVSRLEQLFGEVIAKRVDSR